jgi:hypothetical protein
MIHRIRLNRRRLLGQGYGLVTGVTTQWVSGETLNTQWTNANTYPTVGNPYNYPPLMSPTNVSGSSIFDQNVYNKTLTIPLQLKFEPTDYSEDIETWVGSETQKAINSILDGEKVKYISTVQSGITVEFRFSDRTTTTQPGPYTNTYSSNGFSIPEDYTLNKFNKSYFRLYFYDSNDSETANLLFTEDLPVERSPKSTFILKRLFWEKDDVIMKNTFDDRTIYMEGRFFNAKTGQLQTFYCPPTTVPSPIGIGTYSLTSNREWRTSPITLINPNNNNGEYRFTTPTTNVGGTTPTKITLSEFILT